MKDEEIIRLYWQRNESAITETQHKYGSYLTKISYNILHDTEDTRECINDTYLSAWHSMPPHRPNILSSYLAKIARRISIDRFRNRTREKRGGGEYAINGSPGNSSDAFPLADGRVQIIIPIGDLTAGEYDLHIASFIGEKKAEQPLPIYGDWECIFTVK